MSSLLSKVGATLFGTAGQPTNSYSSPNLDFLKQGAPQVNYDFLNNYAKSVQGGLTGGAKSYLDYLQPSMNNPALTANLADIARTNNQNLGNSVMDSYAKGLVGDGANSDIAANALAQTNAGGDRAVAAAYGDAYNKNADLAAGAASGYNQLAGQGASLEGSALQNYASGLGDNANLTMEQRKQLSDALLANAQGQSGGYHAGTTGLVGSGLTAFAGGLGQGAGAVLGCFSPETEIKMLDGTERRIDEVQPGDMTLGGLVLETRKVLADDLYLYKGIHVSSFHCVFDDGEWMRVGNVVGAIPVPGRFVLHNLVTVDHRIYVNDRIFDDALEYDDGEGHIAALNKETAVAVGA